MEKNLKRFAPPAAIISSIIILLLMVRSGEELSLDEKALVLVTALGIVLWIAHLAGSAITRYPGRRPLAESDFSDLKKVFDATRLQLGDIMIPTHRATAKPARTAVHLRLGDANFVLPRAAKAALRQFLARSNSGREVLAFLRHRGEATAGGTHILMVTGEPGAGKSVLMQELHESLASGVENGNHSLIPIVVLARDIRTEVVERACSSGLGIDWFLKEYYVQYQRDLKPYAEGFRSLPVLIGSKWQRWDFAVIFDGLDEIADRVHYETIQRNLSKLINADLNRLHGSSTTHKYILSCRKDENLDVFKGAYTVHLPGLSGKRFHRFRRNLIKQAGPGASQDVEEILASKRLVPMHRFRSNPYFLSLLLQHVQDARRAGPSLLAGSKNIDFDYVMQEYVKREALARSLTDGGSKLSDLEPRRRSLEAHRDVAQAVLQWLAFYSVHANVESLYAEHAVTSELIQGFAASLEPSESDQGYWRGACCLVRICSGEGDDCSEDRDNEVAIGLFRNDLLGLVQVSETARREGRINASLLQQALSREVFTRAAVSKDSLLSFCDKLANEYAMVQATPRTHAALLLMARGLAAAQLLHILYVTEKDGRVWLRFRHRRLAEYYSACYLRDRWIFEGVRLRFTPWLAPVLNLVVALQCDEAQALAWMVEHLEAEPHEIFEWRWTVGTIAEAAAFASGGHIYDAALGRFSTSLIRTLTRSDRQGDNIIDAGNVVTRMTILNALTRLSSLNEVWSTPQILHPDVAKLYINFEKRLPSEWLVRGFETRVAVETLAGSAVSRSYLLQIGLRGIGSPGAVLESRPTSEASRAFKFFWGLSFAAVMMGELLYLLLLWMGVSSGLRLLAGRMGQPLDVQWLVIGFTVSWCILRAFHYFRSPTSAAKFGAAPWWLLLQSARALHRRLIPRRWQASAPNAVSLTDFAKNAATEFLSLSWLRSAVRGLISLSLVLLKVIVGGSAGLGILFLVVLLGQELSTPEPESEATIVERVAERPAPLVAPEPLVSEREADALRHLLLSAEPEPPAPGLARDVRLILGNRVTVEHNELNQWLIRLRTEKAQLSKFISMLEGAPSGASQSDELRSARARLEAVSALEQSATKRFESVNSAFAIVTGRKRAALFWVVIAPIFIGLVVVVAIRGWKLYNDHRLIRTVVASTDVPSLCGYLLDATLSEAVRTTAINCLMQMEIQDPSLLRRIEVVATALNKRDSTTDRTLSRRAAELAVTLQNRYNHRKAVGS